MHTGIRELMDNLSRYIRRVEADGRMIAFDSNRRGHRDLYQKAVGGVGAEELLLESAEDKVTGDWSADGRWVAYLSDELGRPNVYVRQFAAVAAVAAAEASSPVGQWQVSKAGGIFPVWGPDGKELYYLNPEGALMGAPITVTGATLDTGAPVALFPTRILGGGVDVNQGRQYDVAPDGRFLINTVLDDAATPITLVMNWNPEAKM